MQGIETAFKRTTAFFTFIFAFEIGDCIKQKTLFILWIGSILQDQMLVSGARDL